MDLVDWRDWRRAVADGISGVDDEALAYAAGEILRAGFVVTAGNGGSATLAEHMAQAVAKPDYKPGGAARGAVCITSGAATLTAHANDGCWEDAILEAARPIMQAVPKCAVVVFSSSGRSENIVRLAQFARAGLHSVIAFTGFGGEPLRSLATVSLHVESHDYEVVEPVHDALLHRVQYHLRRLA